jgi:hypothetical protein
MNQGLLRAQRLFCSSLEAWDRSDASTNVTTDCTWGS